MIILIPCALLVILFALGIYCYLNKKRDIVKIMSNEEKYIDQGPPKEEFYATKSDLIAK
jgi:hypothetical protein